MSNINIEIKLSGIKDIDGNDLVISKHGSFDIMLDPFYAMEQDVLTIFMDDNTEYFSSVRKLIFEGSVKADSIFSPSMINTLALSPEEEFRLKREYVICFSVYQFAKIFYRDYLRAVKKSKFLADMKVSLEVEKDPKFITMIADDAKECMEELESLTSSGTGFNSFVKGRLNPCNKRSDRVWYPGIGANSPKIPIAATKASVFCKRYKIGIN